MKKKQITPIWEARWRTNGGKDQAAKGRVPPSLALAFLPARVYLPLAEVKREVEYVPF